MRKYIPENVKLIPAEAECKFQGELFDVYQWPQEMFDGSTATFEMLRREDTVVIIAVLTAEEQRRLEKVTGDEDVEDKVVITYQTQPHQDWFYDYPGGRHDTGLSFANWKLVEVHQPFTKIDWLVYTFVATDLVGQVAQKLDAGEKIKVLEVTLDELREYAKKPNAKYLMLGFMQGVKNLDELRKLPALYEY